MDVGGKTGVGGDDLSSRVTSSMVNCGDRKIFTMELRPYETTIVSWKKLLKDSDKVVNGSGAVSAAGPSMSAAAQAADVSHPLTGELMGNEGKDSPPPNRFSAVIEKIERLYMGKDSSDEEDPNEAPDDDQYDTEDSFIDDAELDEYFEVDNATVKHDGFFVNRGKLECLNEATVPTNQQPRKRRRKELINNIGDTDVSPNKLLKVGKASSRKDILLAESSYLHPTQSLTMMREPHEDDKASKQFNLTESGPNKKSVVGMRDMEKQKAGGQLSKGVNRKIKNPSGSSGVLHQRFQDGNSFSSSRSQSGRSATDFEELNRREKHSARQVPYLNMPDSRQMKTPKMVQQMHRQDGASVRPKVSLLEKAIRDLEMMVAESRPPVTENTENDTTSQAVKRRLPTDIKLKLAKVAKLASSHGKISKELINRLNGIVGHLVQLRTLKRNLKMMVNTSLSAKREKENRFQQIKKEVADLVKVRMLCMDPRHRPGASDDPKELGPNAKGAPTSKFDMDTTVEDRICDLYDLYVDGLDEETGPQIRKLYSELVHLWPSGFMDNHGIKGAICRSKERKRVLMNSRHQDQVRIRRKKLARKAGLASVPQSQNSSLPLHPVEGSAADPRSHTSTSANKQAPVTSAVQTLVNDPSSKQEKAKGGLNIPVDDPRVAEGAVSQKKAKRKPGVDLNEMPCAMEKIPSKQGNEKMNLNPPKRSGGPSTKSSHKQNLAGSSDQS